MRGFKPKEARAAAQNFADGGLVKSVKGFLGLDPERNARIAEYRASEAAKKAAEAPATPAAPATEPQRAITQYTAGSALQRREQAAGLKNGGPVRGPGTGTSDDVPDDVPEGTYIMPADSTQAIGEDALASMGAGKVPVNLSNGEFKLPPEQVHAVGVQALDQMKKVTHTPIPEPGKGDGQGFKSELFFANGGAVDDPAKKPRTAAPPTPPLPGPSDLFMQDRADEMRSQYNAGNYAGVAGTALRTAGQGLGMYALEAADKIVSPVLDVAGRAVGGMFGTDTPAGAVKPAAAAPVAPAAAAPAQASPATPAATAVAPQPATNAAPLATPATAPPQAATTGAVLPNNVTREGNSYSGANIGQGFTINGAQASASANVPSARNMAAAQVLADRYAVPSTGFSVISDDSGRDRERRTLMGAASTPYRGSQNGQLTANQLNVQRGMLTDEARDATSRYQGDQNTATNRDIATMREAGDTQRTVMRETGENARAADRTSLDARRVGMDERAQGFKVNEAQRMEKLRDRYDAAKPEERKAIAQQIRELQGSTVQQDAWAHSPGGQVIDPKTQQLITQPGVIYNRHTGETREAPAAPPTPPQNHVDALKKNPALAAQFDQQYGAGAAARAIGTK